MAIERALEAGASGAKLTGAGGGGFLLVICPVERQRAVRESGGDEVQLRWPWIASARASFSTSNATSGVDHRVRVLEVAGLVRRPSRTEADKTVEPAQMICASGHEARLPGIVG